MIFRGNNLFLKIKQREQGQRMRVVNSSHATRDVGSDVYLKRLYHPPETLFSEVIIDTT